MTRTRIRTGTMRTRTTNENKSSKNENENESGENENENDDKNENESSEDERIRATMGALLSTIVISFFCSFGRFYLSFSDHFVNCFKITHSNSRECMK